MKHTIAEFELSEVSNEKLSMKELLSLHTKKGHLISFLRAFRAGSMYTWIIALIIGAICLQQYAAIRDAAESFRNTLPYLYADDIMVNKATSLTMNALKNEMEAQKLLGITLDLVMMALLAGLCSALGSYIILRYHPYCVTRGMGASSADVMRLTPRGCLLVGRRNGLRMFFPWVAFRSARVTRHCLALDHKKTKRMIVLPLPPQEEEEIARLNSEISAAIDRYRSEEPTPPPAGSLWWHGFKLTSPTTSTSYDLRGPEIKAYLIFLICLCVPALGALLAAGIIPYFTGILVFALLLSCIRRCYTVIRADWHYTLSEKRYKLYSPFNSITSVPLSLLRDIAGIGKKITLLRLQGDQDALLPCVNREGEETLAKLPYTRLSNSILGRFDSHIGYIFLLLAVAVAMLALY